MMASLAQMMEEAHWTDQGNQYYKLITIISVECTKEEEKAKILLLK